MITEQQKQEIHYCDHGCGQVAKYYSKKTGKWRCEKYSCQCPKNKEKIRQEWKKKWKNGFVSPFKGKHHTKGTKENLKLQWKNKYKNDIQFKLSCSLRSRILDALKSGYKKSAHTEELIGYSFEDAKLYIESLFINGMTWDDFLAGRIELHHLQPCHTFDLSDPEQQKECFNITNLYPLWKDEHRQNYDLLHQGEKI